MRSFIGAREDGRSAGRTYRSRHECIGEPHSLGRQLIHVWRLQDWMSGVASGIKPLVVGENEEEIWLCFLSLHDATTKKVDQYQSNRLSYDITSESSELLFLQLLFRRDWDVANLETLRRLHDLSGIKARQLTKFRRSKILPIPGPCSVNLFDFLLHFLAFGV